MSRNMTPSLPETSAEELLCATLSEHAPASVETERAWAAISGRLATLTHAKRPTPRGFRLLPSRGAARHWRLPQVAAAAVLAVVLMGAGVTGSYFVFQKARQVEQEHLYTDVGQRQTSQGVTITVRKAYADAGSSIIAYRIQLAPDLAQRYDHAIVFSDDLTDQLGEEPNAANVVCDNAPFLDVGFAGGIDCVADVSPFHAPDGTSQLTITYTVLKVALMHSGSATTHFIEGTWHFVFTIPFHQPSLGSGGPYVQPSAHP